MEITGFSLSLSSYITHKCLHTLIKHTEWLILKECLRWAFIDLTAGPFSWGPAVGGEGVRTEFSLPNVGKTIGAVEGAFNSFSFTNTYLILCMHAYAICLALIDLLLVIK